ncbi:hypothetical protein M407DRAFT_245730 [Tulasnella calospora MUT 4182]|uniref:Uncharacterized protein n=1 Tax=Tulasnella calospora MUT 4182 TaxID=1051891 RepID=A0A0C3LGT7_9AGAM|nr:hypothetical protein M407DRAFT_246846 [Tulasnella calospora MUT 4182]KIO20672.1 hypothetical protein M407DRAFT_245730 [Tulasnella calospora MUT 4182]
MITLTEVCAAWYPRVLCSGIASGSMRGPPFSLLPPLPYLIQVHTDFYSSQDSVSFDVWNATSRNY